MLEPHDQVVGVAYGYHRTASHLPPPGVDPKVEDVVQVDVRKQGGNDGLNAKDNFEFDRAVRYRQGDPSV
jgi:hypothetical protein